MTTTTHTSMVKHGDHQGPLSPSRRWSQSVTTFVSDTERKTMGDVHQGGCLCGTIRYRILDIFDVVYCHCKTCRHRSGGPVTLSVVVPKGAFELLKGSPSAFRASDVGASHFCGTCGTPLYFAEDHGPYISVSHGSIDESERVMPKAHQWTGSALPWFRIHDELPQFLDGHLSHPDRR